MKDMAAAAAAGVPDASLIVSAPHTCVHKPLFLPEVTGLDWITMVLVFVIAALALASGIGGGGLYVPMLNLLLRFRPHTAVGLSQALIFGGSLGALLVNAREHHPTSKGSRPLIDYGLAAFLSPAEMAGAQLGVMLNQALPSPVILATMAWLLSVLATRTLKKGMEALKKETAAKRRGGETADEPCSDAESGRLLQPPSSAPLSSCSSSSSAAASAALAASKGTSSVRPRPQQNPAGRLTTSPPTSPPPTSPPPTSPPLPASPPPSPPTSPPSSSRHQLPSLDLDCSSPPASPSRPSQDASPVVTASSPRRHTSTLSATLHAPLERLLGGGTIAHVHIPIPVISGGGGSGEGSGGSAGGGGRGGRRGGAKPSPCAPAYETGLLVIVWLGLLAVLVLRGRKGAPGLLGLRPCGGGYWLVTATGFAWLLVSSIIGGRRLVRLGQFKRASEYLEGDVHWDGPRAARCLVQALLAGVMAGLVGVGGGMVLGPMMLELGVLPQVSSATTGTMVLLTSSSAAAVFLLSNLIPLDYALALGLVACAGGLCGKLGLGYLVKKYKLSALIILLLGSLIAVSMLATAFAGLLDLHSQWASGRLRASLTLRAPCSG